MVKLTLADEIHLERIPRGIELVSEGESDRGMDSEKNLAWRAAQIFREASSLTEGVRIHLIKRVPIAAGLGGGSSDAAAVLRGMNRLFALGKTEQGLAQLGAKLGADVPFFCYDATAAMVQGVGDRVTPLAEFPPLDLLLVNPRFSVSTKWVYEEYDRRVGEKLTPAISNASVHRQYCGIRDVVEELHNDLELVTAGRYPQIEAIKSELRELGAIGTLMSGSGPTVFGIFADKAICDRGAEKIKRPGWNVFVTESLS